MSDNAIEREEKLGSCEMLKALYDFKATFAKTLSFKENDLFILHQVSTKQRNWWQVVNATAQVGYVPSNYVCTIQVSPEFWIQFLDGCLEVLRNEGAQGGGCLTSDRQDLLRIFVERRQKGERLLSGSLNEYAPLPPEFQVSRTPVHVPYLTDSHSKTSSSYVSAVSTSECQMPLINSPHHSTFSKQKHKPGRKSTKHVIHLTTSESQFTSNSTEDQNEEPKKSYAVSSIAPSSGKIKDSSENDSDPGSEAAYQLVEQFKVHQSSDYSHYWLAHKQGEADLYCSTTSGRATATPGSPGSTIGVTSLRTGPPSDISSKIANSQVKTGSSKEKNCGVSITRHNLLLQTPTCGRVTGNDPV